MQKLLIAITSGALRVGAGASAAQALTLPAEMHPVGHFKFDAKAKKVKSKADKKSRSAARK